MFLSRPDEKRLWMTIASILGVSIILLLAALQFPWYTVSYYAGPAEYRGHFDFEEARIEAFSNDQPGDTYRRDYGEESPIGDLMGTTEVIIGLGIVSAIAFGALLGAYYYGYLEQTRWIKWTWIGGVGLLVFGVAFFGFRAGKAAANEVVRLLNQANAGNFVAPDPKFWGSQLYGNGELVSAPGVGWLLTILAVLNLAAATVLLYQFPERVPPEEEYGVDEDEETPAGESEPRSGRIEAMKSF